MTVTVRNKAALGTVRMNGDALDAALNERLVAPVELATRLDVTRVTIWRARRGLPVRLSVARRIARILRVPLRSLIVDHDEHAAAEAGQLANFGGALRSAVDGPRQRT